METVVIIGGGISGLIAACNIKKNKPHYKVIIVEKNNVIGGRLFQEKINGFTVNNGPSWLWLNDIIQDIFQKIGIDLSNFTTNNLKTQYKLILSDNIYNISNLDNFEELVYNLDPQALPKIKNFIKRSNYKYNISKPYLFLPNIKFTEYISFNLFTNIFHLDIFSSYRNLVSKLSSNKTIKTILEWPSLFIGSHPSKISGLFTFLSSQMLTIGTQIPSKNGMIDIINLLKYHLESLDIQVLTDTEFIDFNYHNNSITEVICMNKYQHKFTIPTNNVISACDYFYTENKLPNHFRSYPKLYWDKQVMCPSCLIINLVLDTKLPNLEYHNLFFDYSIDQHFQDIYQLNKSPKNPLFYLNITSKLFNEVPDNYENLFILIPTSNNFYLSHIQKNELIEKVINRLTIFTNINIKHHIKLKNIFCDQNFSSEFNAYKFNAYGLGCDYQQIGFFRPKIKSRFISNLYYCGHMAPPGPGVPPSIISGYNASNYLLNNKKTTKWDNLIIFITNIMVMIVTLGTNFRTIWTTIKKEFNFIMFNKFYNYPEYN